MIEQKHLDVSTASFWAPDYVPESAWLTHAPFAFWLTERLRPARFVELGTHNGFSFFAFCQAIARLELGTAAYAVDTWTGDEHAGFYDGRVFESVAAHNCKYEGFSTLMCSTFDEALSYFEECSIDLLHIDGRHLYEDVRHDYESWLPRLTDNAVVLFHDTNVRERHFGVWRFFSELQKKHPSFQFTHGHGLGLICPGSSVPDGLQRLLQLGPEETNRTNLTYASLGQVIAQRKNLTTAVDELSRLEQRDRDRTKQEENLQNLISDAEREIDFLRQQTAEMEILRQRVTEIDRLHRSSYAILADDEANWRASYSRANVLSSLLTNALKGRDQKIARLLSVPPQPRVAPTILQPVAVRHPSVLRRALGKARRSIGLGSAFETSNADRPEQVAVRLRETGLFDETYYLAKNPEVAAAGHDAALHYVLYGCREGRNPSAAFDTNYYVAVNSDVAASNENPLMHYFEYGRAEGRLATPPVASDASLSSIERDEAARHLSNEELQSIREVIETGLFDSSFYRASNPDVVESRTDPAAHFTFEGWKEGRKPNPDFDPSYYLERNPDVVAFGGNPLVHFAEYGLLEARPFLPPSPTVRIPRSGIGGNVRDFGSQGFPRAVAGSLFPEWPVKMPDLFDLRDYRATHRIAVVIHVFYPELWDELQGAAAHMTEPFDLFVTLVRGFSDNLSDTIKKAFPSARVYIFENRGRDILPFMALAATGALLHYELICKLHTKRSPHRGDGDVWRRHLVSALLPEKGGTRELIAAFDADPDLGLIVASGQIFQSEEAWAGNIDYLRAILPLLGFNLAEAAQMPFAGGSMFWIRAIVLHDLVGLHIPPEAYEPEPIAIDGTLAHAVERLFSIVCHGAGLRIEQASVVAGQTKRMVEARATTSPPPAPRVVAFYLPQFHPIPENDRWWGRGFTEWTNVTKAVPLFPGHRQPRLPGELGFTDLRLPETRAAQADLARAHGVSAFCYYYYWFGEHKRLLHRPLDEVLSSGQPDFPFMICWANEPWSRNWDGVNKEILVPQDYEEGWVEAFAKEVAPILLDPRYVRLDGPASRPILMIYRIMHVPEPAEAMARLRTALRDAGVGEVHLAAGWLKLGDDAPLPDAPQTLGLDAFFEFPPHNIPAVAVPSHEQPEAMTGALYDYAATVDAALARMDVDAAGRERHRTVMMGWDNTARRGAAAYVFRGATPGHLRRWLRGLVKRRPREVNAEERLIFINAWNEWAEGTCLEPDRDFGRGWLEAVRNVCDNDGDGSRIRGSAIAHRQIGTPEDLVS